MPKDVKECFDWNYHQALSSKISVRKDEAWILLAPRVLTISISQFTLDLVNTPRSYIHQLAFQILHIVPEVDSQLYR